MRKRHLMIIALAVALVAPAACGSNSPSESSAGAPEKGARGATWLDLPLTDVDGVGFTLGDFAGSPVFVENFATWCPTCRSQLGATQSAAAQLGPDAVFIALSTETSLSPDTVSAYAADNGFRDLRFAVMSPQMLAAMVESFGNSSANPPSTPHVIIDATGVAGEMHTGRISTEDIVADMHAAMA